jgi:5'-nucleotidase
MRGGCFRRKRYPVLDPTSPSQQTIQASRAGPRAKDTATPLDESDDEDHVAKSNPPVDQSQDRELSIMRKVTKKWRRLAGLKDPHLCDELQNDEFAVDWTKVSASSSSSPR